MNPPGGTTIITRNCNECQTEYQAEPRYLNRGQGLFCSNKCSGIYFGRKRVVIHKPNITCSWCGTPFYKKESQQKGSKSGLFFCSREHQGLAFADPAHPVFSGPIPGQRKPTRCPCGVEYSGKRGLCKKCYAQNLIDRWINGDISVTWCGKNKEPHKWVKQYLIDTRGDKCEICGFYEKAPDGRSIIQMDHIDGNYMNNKLNNLQLLCPNHHAMTLNYGSLNKNGGRAHRRKLIR